MAFEHIAEVAKRVVKESYAAARDRHLEEARKALDDWDQTRRLICLVRHAEHAEAAQRMALAAERLEQSRG